jgi:hypothetical protein
MSIEGYQFYNVLSVVPYESLLRFWTLTIILNQIPRFGKWVRLRPHMKGTRHTYGVGSDRKSCS